MKTLVIILLLVPGLVISQPLPRPVLVKSVWRAAFLAPGLMNETRLGDRTTLVSQLRMSSYTKTKEVEISPDQTKFYSSSTVNPDLAVGIRYFYNFDRRLEKAKSIRYNSGNYLSVQSRYRFGAVAKNESEHVPIGTGSGFGVEALWGFQRTYRRNFYLNLALGSRIFRGKAEGVADFTLGYTFATVGER
ncbi:hypothetical protein LX87_05632 [Larkinella arboricola]|uniref:Outer membrane protein with beta-barrel domain n=1 Tax=Larkinella arboricola TaxID=643671 RepID=A0A327WG49_LARAB|nr:hypothetical protein [Larkinella arboricola]RAJ89898.1 hypothetical protein LX87_05632 [Larkinella arboricola]